MTIDSEEFEGRKAHTASAHRVEAEIKAYWADMLADGKERQHIADLLGIPTERMADFKDAPVQVRSAQANAGSAEVGMIVLTWLASEVVLGAFKDVAKDEVKRRLKLVWRYLSDQIDGRLGGKATGWPVILPPSEFGSQGDSPSKPTENNEKA